MTPTGSPSLEAYIRKIERRVGLPEPERSALLSLPATIRQFDGQQEALIEGHPARACAFVAKGLVSRQKHTNGVRHIVGFGFPGDAIDLQSIFFQAVDHSVVTHGTTVLAYVSHADLIDLIDRFPYLAKVVWHDTLIEAAIFREWTLSIGHRPAIERIAHFVLECEQRARQSDIDSSSFELPLTQNDLAAALGLSLVHLNKSLRQLRLGNLVTMNRRQITIQDRAALADLGKFRVDYLHAATPPVFEKPKANGEIPRQKSTNFLLGAVP